MAVNLFPSSAVDSGAKWRLSGEDYWRDSLSTIELPEHQSYKLLFSDVQGYHTPMAVSGTLNSDTVINADYRQAHRIDVVISPEDAVYKGAQWKVAGDNPWNYTGNSAYIYEGDNYSIELKPVDDYYQPAAISGVMPQDDLTVEVIYTWKNWTNLNEEAFIPPRFGAAMTVFNGKCWLIGGSDNTSELNDVWCSDNGLTWNVSEECIPGNGRFGHTLTSWNNSLWLICGISGQNYLTDVLRSSDGNTWITETEAAPFGPRFGHSSYALNGKLWVVCGSDGTSLHSDIWSTSNGSDWTLEVQSSLFGARYGQCVVSDGNKAYLIGGCDGTNLLDDVWSTDDGINWTLLTQTAGIGGRFFHSGGVIGDTLIIVGGTLDPDFTMYDPSYYKSSDGFIWQQITDYSGCCARAMAGSVTFNGSMLIACGLCQQGVLGDLWVEAARRSSQSLSVTLQPEAAVAEGAKWRYTGTQDWCDSGTVLFMAQGTAYEIEFKPIQGWQTPANISGTVGSQETVIVQDYMPITHTFTVNLTPQGAVNAGASWKFLGESGWRSSGDAVSVREGGTYEVLFRNDLAGWVAPASISGTMGTSDTTEFAAYSVIPSHKLTVNISPSVAYNAGGKWKLLGESNWRSSGSYVDLLEGATYEITFRDIIGYEPPANITGTVSTTDKSETGTYSAPAWSRQTASAAFGGRYGHGSAVLNGKLFVIGGYDGTYRRDIWSTVDGIAWTKECDVPFAARYSFGCTVHDGKIWIAGGGVSTGTKSDVWQSPDGKNWIQVTADGGYGARNAAVLESFEGKLWLIGGNIAGCSKNDVWSSYNGVTWTKECDALFTSRYCHGTSVYANKIWVVGGYTTTNNTYLRDVWNSADGKNWTQVCSQGPFSARFGTCAAYDGRLWLSCGKTTGGGTVADVWYTKDGVSWTQAVSTGLTSRYCHSMTAFNGSLWIIAGSTGSAPYLNDTWNYYEEPVYGQLTVQLNPADAVTSGAEWRLIGESSWRGSGSCALVQEGDGYKLEFRQTGGYCTPNVLKGVMPIDGTTENVTYAEYNQNLSHNLTVTISPPGAVFSGAGWRLSGENLWRGSGSSVSLIEGSACTVEYRDVIGYSQPESVHGTMEAGDITVTCVYQAVPWTQGLTAGFGGRYGHGNVVLNGKMFVIGGYDGTYRHDVWSTIDGLTWTKECDAPFSSRYLFGCTVHEGKIWIAGGNASTVLKSDVWQSSDGKNWTQVSADGGFTARSAASLLSFEGKLWLIGGCITGGASRNDVWSSVDGITWTKECDAPFTSRFCHGTEVYANKIWVVGGYTTTNNTYLKDVWNSTDGKNWTQVSSQNPFSARYGTCTSYNGRLWLSCGKTYGDTTVADIWYTKDGVNWTQAYSTGLSPRYCHSMTAFNGSLWIIAGSTGTTPYLNDTWSYYEAPVLGQLTVQLNPADAVASGAGWRMTGESVWRNSGTSASVQESDGYMLEFRQTGGYCTPDVLKGVMPLIGTTENVTYVPYNQNLSHNLTVILNPVGAVSSGAGWRLSGEIQWRNSGVSVSLIEGSNYVVEYRDAVGYSQPESVYGTMEAGDVNITCTYQAVAWTQGQTAGFGGRYGHGSAVLNGKLFVIGGYDGTYRHDVWSTGDGITWTKECDAPFTARYSFGCTVHDGKIWIAGGGVSTGLKADVWQSADGKNWTQVTADGGFGARNATGLESFGGKLWLIGGCITGSVSKNDVWSSVNGITWTKECDAPFASRYCLGTAVYDNKIWAVGGYTTTNNTYLRDVWNSADGANWTQVCSQGPFGARFGTCAAYDGRLWLSCGKTTGGTTVADVWYTKDGVNWIQAPATGLSPRYCHSMTEFNGSLWIIGGSTGSTPYLNDTWCYYDDPEKYLLSVTITPSAAITAGAQWSIDGGNTWNYSGESLQIATATTFEVSYKDVTNYVTPANSAGTMENADIQVAGNYLPVYGALWHQTNGNAEFPPRYGAGATAFTNELWVTGGFNGTAYYSDVW
ncbi:MAG: kelch repeat-containing protein, partial [Candidatus Wallbacteria bacterium]|nr:kelch repeat-containing protein [Candidatus Wallbacteria bacterium]